MCFNPRLNYIFASNKDKGVISIFDVGKPGREKFSKVVGNYQSESGGRELLWLEGRSEFALGFQNGNISFWSAKSGKPICNKYLLFLYLQISRKPINQILQNFVGLRTLIQFFRVAKTRVLNSGNFQTIGETKNLRRKREKRNRSGLVPLRCQIIKERKSRYRKILMKTTLQDGTWKFELNFMKFKIL